MKPLTVLGLTALGLGSVLTGFNRVKHIKHLKQAKQVKSPGNVGQVSPVSRVNNGVNLTAVPSAMPSARSGSAILENRHPSLDERPTYFIPSHAAILILE